MQVHWSRGAIPNYMAASGPVALRIAGRVADGAIVHMVHFPGVVNDAFGFVRQEIGLVVGAIPV
jgi:hypothetical protein